MSGDNLFSWTNSWTRLVEIAKLFITQLGFIPWYESYFFRLKRFISNKSRPLIVVPLFYMFLLSWFLFLEILLPLGKVFVKLCLRFVFLLASGTYFNLVNFLHQKVTNKKWDDEIFKQILSTKKGVCLRSCKYKSPLKSTLKFTRITNLSGFCCCFSYSLLRSNTKC